jgi:zinc transport system substrate-binding protein
MKRTLLLCAVGFACLCACGGQRAASVRGPITVAVSILPQKYFVDKVGGAFVNCIVMVPPGTNAHSFEPKPAQMSLLTNASVYFGIGLEFERAWISRFSAVAPGMRIVHTDSGIIKLPSEDADERDPDGGPGLDPHIWLSPALVKKQVRAIAAALAAADTAHASAFASNRDAFLARIDSLDARIRDTLGCAAAGNEPRKTFLVYHPTWGYFARDYCLRQISIEEGGREPSPRVMKSIVDTARICRIHTVFAQPEFSRQSAEVVAREIGATVVDADALAYDWENNLLTVARRMAEQ